ncbi:MAG: hypothetical protein A2908_02360 [Candidatus Staskawiczbacteria bacterium RIFCSPLOWO2_01_FULL_38_12b]|uniref:Uncharacterized protein n=1 Tax=Candidatus Staskawiczbacteria bacterium RIFCSPLOWO2_01_FULL_38_12b TaxID=1802214 RepID=A0A1G2IBU7_9BACT|nr:MAG: hypothetical protein A2908_02360 [Candidatus Staskawiczbacteria bacterium RIFCSPLOWO2_01_FULL_38_12b]
MSAAPPAGGAENGGRPANGRRAKIFSPSPENFCTRAEILFFYCFMTVSKKRKSKGYFVNLKVLAI